MYKVLSIGKESKSYRKIFEDHGIEISFCDSKDEDVIAECGKDAEAIIFTNTKFTSSLFDKLPNLKIISRSGIGIDTVDMDAATSHGVIVCNSANYGTYDVAEHTVALLLSFIHSVPKYDSALKSSNDWSCAGIPMAVRLSEKTIGIIGFGRISKWICKMLSGFGMNILVYDPYASKESAAELGVKLCELDEIFDKSDIISTNAPLTNETYHIINTSNIEKMKDGVIIVNTSRGALIDEAALVSALESGKVGGAALDVFEEEPFPADSKLLKVNNVILTPHVAWRSEEAVRDLKLEVTGNIIDYFEGKPLRNALNLK